MKNANHSTFMEKNDFSSRKKSLALLFFFAATALTAQVNKGAHVITVGSFASFVGDYRQLPVFATYDYSISDRVSLGLLYAETSHSISTPHYQRHSFGARVLGHFGPGSDSWDFYAGIQGGINYWASSSPKGTELNPRGVFPFFPVHSGDVTGSGQVIFGARYLVLGWMGISSEIAIGTPYIFSLGLSINAGNTSAAVKTIHDNYHAELAAVEKKNVIKLNASSLIGIPGIAYERHLANRFSIEAGGSFQFAGSPLQFNSTSIDDSLFSESDSISQVLKIYGLVKFYITAREHAFPEGLYIGAIYNYAQREKTMHVVDLHSNAPATNYDYTKETEEQSGGIVVGYQKLFGKHFTIDLFGGFQFGTARLLSVKYADPNVTEENFNAHFGGHQVPLQPELRSTILKLSVGYAF